MPYLKTKHNKYKLIFKFKNNMEGKDQNKALNKTDVSGSLPYNEKVLMHLWYSRNPSHEINTNTEEDMFWKTVFMVMKDYIREVGGNDR